MRLERYSGILAATLFACSAGSIGCSRAGAPPIAPMTASTTTITSAQAELPTAEETAPRVSKAQRSADDAALAAPESKDEESASPRRDDGRRGGFSGWK